MTLATPESAPPAKPRQKTWRAWALLAFLAGLVAGGLGVWGVSHRSRAPKVSPVPAKSVRIALCQYGVVAANPAETLRRVSRVVRTAFRHGATYVLLPELSFLCSPGLRRLQGSPDAVDEAGVITAMARLARRYEGYILVGHLAAEEGGVRNAGILLGPDGKVHHTHRKTVLALVDHHARLREGNDIEWVETPHGRIGVLICREASDLLATLRQPDPGKAPRIEGLAQEAKETFDDAHLLVLQLAHAGNFDRDVWSVYVRERLWESAALYAELAMGWAEVTGAFVALVNKSGNESNYQYGGHSCAVSPNGRLLGSAGYMAGILLIDLPLDEAGRIDRSAKDRPTGFQRPVPLD